MKPDPLPPTIPMLAFPLSYQPPAPPQAQLSLTSRMHTSTPDLRHCLACLLLALYALGVVLSAVKVHQHFHNERATTHHP